MRYELRDYQRDAALEVLKRLRRGRRDWQEDGERSSFALSAITGSGKTVIATAVIEALLFGSTDLDTDADPRVAFLWITDDPALNRQTRARMFDASELLAPTTLVEVDESFLDADLAPGRVYFLNTQKLSKSSRLAQGGTNAREFSFWDVLRNTIRGDTTDLVHGPRRGAPGHEARGRPQDDRVAPDPRRAGLQPADPDRVGHLGHDRALHDGDGRGDGPDGLPERRGRHRARPRVGPHQGRDRPRPARREGHLLDDAAARGGEGDAGLRAALGGVLGRRGRARGAAGAGRPGTRQGERRQARRARRHDRGGVARPRPAGDRPRPGRARAARRSAPARSTGSTRSRSRPTPTCASSSPRRRSRPGGTARGPRSSTPSGRRRTRRTSPRSSAAWSASRSPTGSPPTTPSTRSPATCRCSTRRRSRASRTSWRARAPGTGRTGSAPAVIRAPMLFERNAALDPGGVRAPRGPAEHPDAGPHREPAPSGAHAGAAARRRRRRRAAARRRRRGPDEAAQPAPGRAGRRARGRCRGERDGPAADRDRPHADHHGRRGPGDGPERELSRPTPGTSPATPSGSSTG